MARGISTNRNVTSHAPQLKQQGVEFVFRYYSRTTHQEEKRLTMSEAEAISRTGMHIGVVYEDKPTSLSYFSHSRGHLDGVNAHHYARSMHQPPKSAIYFAIDYDAASEDISGAIHDYFLGVDKGMRDAGGGERRYAIGVYGSGAACSWLKAHCPFIHFTWLAESTGWLGSSNYDEWTVKQSIATHDLAGLTSEAYEDCTSNGTLGGFVLGHGTPVAHADHGTPPPADIHDKILDLLEHEWSFFGKQTENAAGALTHAGHKENQEGFFERVGKYWHEALGETLDGRDDTPWSAAFVSWIMKKAGAGNRFHYSAVHATYLSRAISDRLNHNPASFFLGFRLHEHTPQLGDLIGRARQPRIDYDHQAGGQYLSHSDIVFAKRHDEIDVIGGNVSNSVTKRTLKLDAHGHLTSTSGYFVVVQNKLP